MQSTSQESCRSSAGLPPIAITMRIKRRLATLLFKGRRSLHTKAPHSFDVRIGVDSGLWRVSAISAIPNAQLVRTTERLAWIHRKQSLVEGNR